MGGKSKSIFNQVKYAIREIVLVVIGILIAVNINNWNENRKKIKELSNIYKLVGEDLKNDIKEIDKILNIYEENQDRFALVLSDTLEAQDFKNDRKLPFLIMSFPEFSVNQRGNNLLSNYNASSLKQKDTLATQIVNFYAEMLHEVKVDDELRTSNFQDIFDDWKSNHDWWSDFLLKENEDSFINYALNDPDFKNKVATTVFIAYRVFLPELKEFKAKAESIIKSVEKRN